MKELWEDYFKGRSTETITKTEAEAFIRSLGRNKKVTGLLKDILGNGGVQCSAKGSGKLIGKAIPLLTLPLVIYDELFSVNDLY